MDRDKLIAKLMDKMTPLEMISQLRRHMARLDSELALHISEPTIEREQQHMKTVLLTVKIYLQILYTMFDVVSDGGMSRLEKHYFEIMGVKFDEEGL